MRSRYREETDLTLIPANQAGPPQSVTGHRKAGNDEHLGSVCRRAAASVSAARGFVRKKTAEAQPIFNFSLNRYVPRRIALIVLTDVWIY